MNTHPTAIIGDPPEHRDYRSGQRTYFPQVARSARINSFVTVDAGLERATVVGERVFLLTKSHIGHDAIIGDDCEVATGAIVGGHAEIGKGVKIGLNAVILPFRKVGDGARIGAGAVVTHDVPAGETWAGVPARLVGGYVPERERAEWSRHYAPPPQDAEGNPIPSKPSHPLVES